MSFVDASELIFRCVSTKKCLEVHFDSCEQEKHYTNIDWCQGKHWKITPRSCVMLPEGNIAQLRGIIFQCWSRLTVDICFVISRKTAFRTLLYQPIQTRNSHTFNLTRNMCSNFCQRSCYFRISKFFKVSKRQKKTTYKPF